jgi:hypothetical protein
LTWLERDQLRGYGFCFQRFPPALAFARSLAAFNTAANILFLAQYRFLRE